MYLTGACFNQRHLRGTFSRCFRFFFPWFYYLYVIYFLREHATQLERINSRTGNIARNCLLFAIELRTFVTARIRGRRHDKRKSVRDTYDSKLAQCTVLHFALDVHVGREFSVVAKWWTAIASFLSSHWWFSPIHTIFHCHFPKLLKKSHLQICQ